jgi:hypothetical protein
VPKSGHDLALVTYVTACRDLTQYKKHYLWRPHISGYQALFVRRPNIRHVIGSGMWASPDDIGGEAFSGLPSHLEAFAGVSFGAISRHPFQPQ